MLVDRQGRLVNYLRLAVTDRCNLRCFYCMPEKGIEFLGKRELLSYEELLRISSILAKEGVSKIRITGGEPFLRKDMIYFLKDLRSIPGVDELHVTTNGTRSTDLIEQLKALDISSVNLSLDSLDKARFLDITRRDLFDNVMDTLKALIAHGIKTKINAVVMAGRNIEDIIPLVNLAKTESIDVRFIEEMPFNGIGVQAQKFTWNHVAILNHIRDSYPAIYKIEDPAYSTSRNYKIPNFKGSIGIIAAYSRTFCGTCNRIRLTPKGLLKTCLYDKGVFNLKDLLRAGASDQQVLEAVKEAIGLKAVDGFAAEANRENPIQESMATIGG